MKTSNLSNVIFEIFLLLNIEALKFTLNVSIKISSNTNVTFAKRHLAQKLILIGMYSLCMKTRSSSNVICAVILLSKLQT
jgi:hypothetical protein